MHTAQWTERAQKNEVCREKISFAIYFENRKKNCRLLLCLRNPEISFPKGSLGSHVCRAESEIRSQTFLYSRARS